MYSKQLFHKVLDLVDNDIADHFRSIPEETFKDEETFPAWDYFCLTNHYSGRAKSCPPLTLTLCPTRAEGGAESQIAVNPA